MGFDGSNYYALCKETLRFKTVYRIHIIEAWLLVHAYAGTRFTVLMLWKLRRMDMHGWVKNSLIHKVAYDIATMLARTLMLRITFDTITVLMYCTVWWAARTAWLSVQEDGGNDAHGLGLYGNERYVNMYCIRTPIGPGYILK